MAEHAFAHHATTTNDYDEDRAEHFVFPASMAYEKEEADGSLAQHSHPDTVNSTQQHAPRSSSDRTLQDEHAPNEKKEDQESDDQKQEEEGQQGPPPPVGFFDSRLHQTRITVAKKYCFTSKSKSLKLRT